MISNNCLRIKRKNIQLLSWSEIEFSINGSRYTIRPNKAERYAILSLFSGGEVDEVELDVMPVAAKPQVRT